MIFTDYTRGGYYLSDPMNTVYTMYHGYSDAGHLGPPHYTDLNLLVPQSGYLLASSEGPIPMGKTHYALIPDGCLLTLNFTAYYNTLSDLPDRAFNPSWKHSTLGSHYWYRDDTNLDIQESHLGHLYSESASDDLGVYMLPPNWVSIASSDYIDSAKRYLVYSTESNLSLKNSFQVKKRAYILNSPKVFSTASSYVSWEGPEYLPSLSESSGTVYNESGTYLIHIYVPIASTCYTDTAYVDEGSSANLEYFWGDLSLGVAGREAIVSSYNNKIFDRWSYNFMSIIPASSISGGEDISVYVYNEEDSTSPAAIFLNYETFMYATLSAANFLTITYFPNLNLS